MAQYPVSKNPDELEAWKTMMESMIKFISASTKLMNTINERALQGPPEDEGPAKQPCEVECLICGPTRSPKICQKCAALPAIAPKSAAAAVSPPSKAPEVVITPAADKPPAEEALHEEPPAEKSPEDKPPAEEPPAEEPPAGEPPAEEPPAEEPPAEEPLTEETPADVLPAEEAPPEEPPTEEALPEEPPAEGAPPVEAPPPEESSDETQYLAPPAAGTPRKVLVPATGGGPGATNCCCEEIKDLKAAAKSLGVRLPEEGGEGERPPCDCPKDEAPPPVSTSGPTKSCCVCSKKAASETTPPAKSCCCQEKKRETQGGQETDAAKQCICAEKRAETVEESEERGKICCCAEKKAEEKNKSVSAGAPCECGQSQNEGKPCGCGSNLDAPEPPLKLCACPPGDDEKDELAAELIEKVDKAETEIQQLRQELQRLQYFQAAARTPAATMYKEIMKDIYAGKCNPKKKPVLAPPAKLKRPGESGTAPATGAGSPEPTTRSLSRSVVRMATSAEQSAGCSPTCPSAVPTTPPSTPVPADLPGIVRSYSRSVDRTVTPAGAEGCSPVCPAATSTPKRGSEPRRGPTPPCVSRIGGPGLRKGSSQQQPSSRTPFQMEQMMRAQTQVATRGSMPSTLDSTDPRRYDFTPTPTPTQWKSLPSGNVTICTPSGGPDSAQMPMSDCEQYGCMEDAEEQPDENYCTDYNCDNEDCTLRPKEEKKGTDDGEKETKDIGPTSSMTPSKSSEASKSASKASKISAASKPGGEGQEGEEEPAAGETLAEEGGEEAPAEKEE